MLPQSRDWIDTRKLYPGQTEGVIEQVAVAASQNVCADPGAAGVKSIEAEPVTSAEVMAALGLVHACGDGEGMVMPVNTEGTAMVM